MSLVNLVIRLPMRKKRTYKDLTNMLDRAHICKVAKNNFITHCYVEITL